MLFLMGAFAIYTGTHARTPQNTLLTYLSPPPLPSPPLLHFFHSLTRPPSPPSPSLHAGLIYNDYFALPLNLFGSRYAVSKELKVRAHVFLADPLLFFL